MPKFFIFPKVDKDVQLSYLEDTLRCFRITRVSSTPTQTYRVLLSLERFIKQLKADSNLNDGQKLDMAIKKVREKIYQIDEQEVHDELNRLVNTTKRSFLLSTHEIMSELSTYFLVFSLINEEIPEELMLMGALAFIIGAFSKNVTTKLETLKLDNTDLDVLDQAKKLSPPKIIFTREPEIGSRLNISWKS